MYSTLKRRVSVFYILLYYFLFALHSNTSAEHVLYSQYSTFTILTSYLDVYKSDNFSIY